MVQDRAEVKDYLKDYLDIAKLLERGLNLAEALGAAVAPEFLIIDPSSRK